MNASRRARLAFGKAAVSAVCAVIASPPAAQEWLSRHVDPAAAQQWPSLYADAPTAIAVDPSSLSQVQGLSGVVGAWFQYTHPEQSARCIPPPRACYAKSQRVYFHINCANGSLAQIQRITFDLNGDVSSQSDPEFNAFYYLPPFPTAEARLARSICSGTHLSLPAVDPSTGLSR